MYNKGIIEAASFEESAAMVTALSRNINLVNEHRRKKLRQQRTRFALFLKILGRRLEQSGEDEILCELRRLVKFYSQRENRAMRNSIMSCAFVDCIEKPVRALVGEHRWIRAHILMQYYISRKTKMRSY